MSSSMKWVVGLVGLLIVWMVLSSAAQKKTSQAVARQQRSAPRVVGVAQSSVTTTMDLSDKLNPAILPDVLKEVFREVAPTGKPESAAFQQAVVKKLSQKIMDDPEVNYRVDLNEDKNMDPILVVPESVAGEAAVYSVRVPDPDKHKTDPPANADWNKIAEDGIELVALSVTFDESTKTMSVDSEPNEHLYHGSRHYNSSYPVRNHSWMESYFTYMIFRDVLFRPYGWYGPRWYGGWYGGYYGGWHAPVYSRTTIVNNTYNRSTGRATGARTSSGRSVRSSRASSRSTAPAFVSRRNSAAAARASSRTSRTNTSRSRPRTSRSSSRSGGSFRGGGFGGGK